MSWVVWWSWLVRNPLHLIGVLAVAVAMEVGGSSGRARGASQCFTAEKSAKWNTEREGTKKDALAERSRETGFDSKVVVRSREWKP
jgi:hypothetical protein